MVKKVHIKSFGCQMNKLDSSLVASALTQAGFAITQEMKEADVILINTCSVRDHAEQRVLSNLGHLKHLKKSRPDVIVAVIGCMAQRIGPQLLSHDVIDIVAGPSQIPQIPQLLLQTIETRRQSIAITENIRTAADPEETSALDDFELKYDSDSGNPPAQAFVRVMRGCNNFCSYCVVPYVRGPEDCRSPKTIAEQVKKLADAGIKQITLLGQTVNSYRYTQGDKTFTLADLLEITSAIDGIRWVRFITSHPAGFDDSVFRAMADIPKVCPYLHMPAQSGSDKILKAMNRGYTARQYLDAALRARQFVPDVAIASDFIVGFPGETEKDFQATISLLKEVRFKNSFIFKYSPRPGTRADKNLIDDIPLEVKKQRNTHLLDLQNQISEQDNKKFLNRTIEVLVEGPSKKPHLNNPDSSSVHQLTARTADDYIVVFQGHVSLAGNFAKVKITGASPLTLFAQLA